MRKYSLLTVSILAALVGCGGGGSEAGSGVLALEEADGSIRGTYELDGESIEFESVRIDDGVYDVMVTLHGMVLAAVIDPSGEALNLDGFADAGGDTQILESDRAILGAFSAELASALVDAEGASDVLVRAVGHWAQTPDSVPLERLVIGERDRSWTSICGSYGTYQYATHDGWSHNRWDRDATSVAHVGDRAGSTWSYYSNAWRTSEPDHVSYVSQYGECYGNCGGGCPGGNQTLTWDCHDHDQCVRSGHDLVSMWCNDEFTSASDDEFFATRCSGT